MRDGKTGVGPHLLRDVRPYLQTYVQAYLRPYACLQPCSRPGASRIRAGAVAAFAAVMLAAVAVAGCASKAQQPQAVDPNLYPTNYRSQITVFLRQSLSDRADFRGAQIGQPVLKPVGSNPHYVVCVQFNAAARSKPRSRSIWRARSPNSSTPPRHNAPTRHISHSRSCGRRRAGASERRSHENTVISNDG